jgi:tight adherence protein B
VWFTQQARRRVTTMEKQLPLLLSGLSAQLQAGSNIQQALLAVADDLPEPLGDELRIVKQDINVAVPIDVAMRRLSARVPSREMQFLASSIEIAVRSGSNLEPQIRTIEGVVAQRTRLRQKLATAIASVRPTQIIAIAAVPVFFLNSIRDQQNQAFWLSPEALPWIVGIIFFTVFGLWGIRILIKRIETM